jgi:O-antigen ligase
MSKVIIIIALTSALIYIASVSNYDETLMWLRSKFKSIGFSTRILDMLLNDEFVAFTNGRTDIRTIAISFITQRPFFGWGFFSEYAVTGIAYSHNFVVDLMFEYGIPIGVSIFIFILARVHKSLTLLRGDRDQQVFMLMLFSVGIVKLMLSGTYLTEGYLFMLLGFCAKTVRDRKSIIRSDRRYLAMAYR